MRTARRLILSIIVLAVVLVFANTNFYLDWLWFRNLNYSSVFWTLHLSRWGMRIIAWLVFFLFFLGNLLAARRSVVYLGDSYFLRRFEGSPLGGLLNYRNLTILFLVVSAVLSFFFTSYTGAYWLEFRSFLAASEFGIADPIFNTDVSFYIFTLPFYRFLYNYFMSMVVLTAIVTGVIYYFSSPVVEAGRRLPILPRHGQTHLSLLFAAAFALKAWDYWLQAHELLFSPRGAVFGVGYTDINANLPILRLLAVLAGLLALLNLANIFLQRRRLLLYGIGILLLTSLGLGTIYPALVQQFQVEPNEFAYERPYIEYNIAFTQKAFGLDKIKREEYPAIQQLTWEDLHEVPGTMENVRLWDYRPLHTTYNQLQAIRPYYEFRDVDTDRYWIDGQYRQVMLSARELNKEMLDPQAQTWVNLRLQYTHGYGLAMSPVAEVGSDGLPHYTTGDLPIRVNAEDLAVEQPEIYYGELTDDFVIVNTNTPEFNYPAGETNIYTEYEGSGGIELGSFLRRLLFAFKFADYRIIISQELENDSRVMFDRNIHTRVKKIAPFLRYEQDAYPVIGDDGRLYWIRDAYTVSSRFPYAQPYSGINYIRNSVKAVVDAYNGDVGFYIADESEPLIQTYSKIFPGLFRPLKEMPAGLEAHIRYPEYFFSVQAEVYATYHMNDPNVFYNREDLWQIPLEQYFDQRQPMEPYYTILQLPGESEEEFVLILPYTPVVRDNMIAWLAGRSDGENYGELVIYLFPKERVVFGPSQIENRIDQDTEISEQLSLWDQHGSNVIRGNLLVLPIKESILYVEPIYLQAEQGGLPELTRVIVAFGDKIIMESSLDLALMRIFGERPENIPPEESPGELPDAPIVIPGELSELARRAREVYEEAQERLREGDWAGYGELIDELGEILSQLEDSASDSLFPSVPEELLEEPQGGD